MQAAHGPWAACGGDRLQRCNRRTAFGARELGLLLVVGALQIIVLRPSSGGVVDAEMGLAGVARPGELTQRFEGENR